MEKRKGFKDLRFWQKVCAIALNFAEGYKREGVKDELRLINMTQGAFGEIRYCTIPLKDLNARNIEKELKDLIEEASKILNAHCISTLNSLNS